MNKLRPVRTGHCHGGPASGNGRLRRAGLTARWAGAAVAALALMVLVLPGCEGAAASSPAELAAFSQAGPVRLQTDLQQLLSVQKSQGLYRLIPGDVVELQMPAILRLSASSSGDEMEPHRCRIDSAGNIILPIIGEVPVAGRTLAEVEATLVHLYYPKYVLRKPSIVASVSEHRVGTVSLIGAVQEPGVYELRSNEMSLFFALMKAGGIAEEGASAIHVVHRSGQKGSKTTSVPVVGMTTPAEDVELSDGDTIMVDARAPQVVTVVGLVKTPGLLACSAKDRYTVMDALAFAGGINKIADPQFVKVYRQDDTGKVVSVVLRLDDPSAMGSSDIYLKPGDVVAVEQTSGTRTRLLLSTLVRVGLGLNAGASVSPF